MPDECAEVIGRYCDFLQRNQKVADARTVAETARSLDSANPQFGWLLEGLAQTNTAVDVKPAK